MSSVYIHECAPPNPRRKIGTPWLTKRKRAIRCSILDVGSAKTPRTAFNFESKVPLAVALTIVPAAMAAYGGVKSVDKDLETLLFSLGARRFQVFAKVVVPWAMPWIVSSLRVNIGLALAGAIVGEFIASRFGVGRMILYAGQIMDINLVWVGVVVLSILALVMYAAVTTAERYLLKGMLHGSQPSTH
jgi:NitT/TauT family transport system permease protein